MDRRYLFHRDIHEDDVISQDPGIKPLEEMVRPGQRLRMTIILRMEDSYEENCPKCHLERSAEFNGPVLSWYVPNMSFVRFATNSVTVLDATLSSASATRTMENPTQSPRQ